jgi:hypothetical protein
MELFVPMGAVDPVDALECPLGSNFNGKNLEEIFNAPKLLQCDNQKNSLTMATKPYMTQPFSVNN